MRRKKRLKAWWSWSKFSNLNWFQKLLVLFGLKRSQHFESWLLIWG